MRGRGPLVRVQIGPNRFAKMYEKDAKKKGYLYEKERGKSRNKMLETLENKVRPAEPDDFAEIDGVGKSTKDELYKAGIYTFDQLLNTDDLSFLNALGMKAILDWKSKLLEKEPVALSEQLEEPEEPEPPK